MTNSFWINFVRYIVSVTFLIIVWALIVWALRIPAYVLPPPDAVIGTLLEEFPWFMQNALATLINVILGGIIGIGAGICVGILVAYSRVLLWLIEPYLVIFQSFPREALIPVIVVWLGFGAAPKVVNAALLSFFPMALITMNSLLDTRAEYLELVRNWGASKWQEFLYCRVPYSAYSIAGGLKIAVPLALIGGVLGEFMGGSIGLGHIIISSGANFRMDRSFAAIVVLATIGIGALACVRLLQEVVLKRFKQE